MCTVTWFHGPDGYQLFCNRDEFYTRRPAQPPHIRTQNGIRYMTPTDGNAGGSWIGVNQAGVTLCLLNRYYHGPIVPSTMPGGYTSRGLLVTDLLDCVSQQHLLTRIEQIDFTQFQPFMLLVLEPDQPALLVHWNGHEVWIEHHAEASMPLISAYYELERVRAYRNKHLQHLLAQSGTLNAEMLYAFHRSHTPEPSIYSVCVHRNDGGTVSFSWIKVMSDSVAFLYQPESPCCGILEEPAQPLIDVDWRCSDDSDSVGQGVRIIGMPLERERSVWQIHRAEDP